MNKLIIRAIGLILIVGIISVGCDSVVDSDSALTETDVTIQSENSALASGAHIAAISSPEMDQVVYENTLYLSAFHNETTVDDVTWAVRLTSSESDAGCLANTDVVGNVRDNDNEYEWDSDAGTFSASFDISDWEPGQYCFVVSSLEEEPTRLVQWFYIVDEYAKVGGTIGMGEAGRGNSPTHAFEGLIGNAGDAGIVGEVSINFRQLGETCTFTPGGLALRDAPAIVEGDNVRADLGGGSDLGGDDWINSCGGTAHIILLDRDAGAMADNDGESYPRGAVVVDASDGIYSIESYPTPRWVGLERGNIHVGIR